MDLPKLSEIEAATLIVHRAMAPTPQYTWPLLNEHVGTEVWVKHENHTPLGAFKIRGGIVYMKRLVEERPKVHGIIAATKGNHGQSVALAAKPYGLKVKVVVPSGNSIEKNAAMRAHGVELVEHGDDFQDAYDHALLLALEDELHFIPSFDRALVCGVSTYAMELFRAVADIDTLYVPVGLGSGVCGAMAVRDALGLKTEIVGVVAAAAPAYARSFAAKTTISNTVADTIADGIACRTPDADALKAMLNGVSRIITVEESAIGSAMRTLFSTTHNLAEGAGAAALAALMLERDMMRGRRVAIILSGANVDADKFARVLTGQNVDRTTDGGVHAEGRTYEAGRRARMQEALMNEAPEPSEFSIAVKVIGGKWKAAILWELHCCPRRFSRLRRRLSRISGKVLTEQLRAMEEDGVIGRQVYPGSPPKVVYFLTEHGAALNECVTMLSRWGKAHRTRASSRHLNSTGTNGPDVTVGNSNCTGRVDAPAGAFPAALDIISDL